MRTRTFHNKIQGWLGGLFLLASIAFILMTMSLSAAFADPVQQYTVPTSAQQSPRSNQRNTNPRATQATPGVRAAAGNAVSKQGTTTNNGRASRAVSARTATQRTSTARTAAVANRTVRTRNNNSAPANRGRSVVARTGTMVSRQQARVGLTGPATMRGVATTTSSALRTQLAATTYSNIIDPSTGMISADAYSNCLQSYYTCMDEVCAARNPGARRCACAGRVKTFNSVEAQLQTAKEDLLKVSGELSLLIATKGDSIRVAFELTNAEKSLNCVSFREAKRSTDANAVQNWCAAHSGGISVSTTGGIGTDCENSMNQMCADVIGGTDWMTILNGADSDILTSLQTYASTIEKVNVINPANQANEYAWMQGLNNVDFIVNGSNGIFSNETSVDQLAETWGYELFQYGHNNVCGRVLDSCFNGIYEACGNRPAEQGGGSGPYNLNSKIQVTNDSNIAFSISKAISNAGTAACYGYTATSGDPYGTLRQPVAEARLSVLQKYVLDANADCDLYGEELKIQAQNMAYQKIAATQLLQQKRLEFAKEKETARTTALADAKQNFLRCLDNITQCRNDKNRDTAWAGNTIRIKNFCNQMSNVPSCYEQMICDQEATEIIDTASDSKPKNTVVLSEIIESKLDNNDARETCMTNTLGISGTDGIRSWAAPPPTP